MIDGSSRSGDFRYTVTPQGAAITPLASVEVFMGPQRFQVLNLSLGGIALLFDKEPTFSVGDILDVSTSIRDRAFPVRIEIRGIKGFRVSCSFVNAPKNFIGALREFLKPKSLGVSLRKVEELSKVEGSERFEVFSGSNRTLALLWTNVDLFLQKIVLTNSDLVFEWTHENGFRTGRLTSQSLEAWDLEQFSLESIGFLSDTAHTDRIKWDRTAETTVLHYFADILLAWLDFKEGADFVEELMRSEAGLDEAKPLRFPKTR